METEDLLYEQYRQVNIYLKRIINEEKDIHDVKFYIEECQHKLAYIYKLKERILKEKGAKKKWKNLKH